METLQLIFRGKQDQYFAEFNEEAQELAYSLGCER
jgi:hypothetical protein